MKKKFVISDWDKSVSDYDLSVETTFRVTREDELVLKKLDGIADTLVLRGGYHIRIQKGALFTIKQVQTTVNKFFKSITPKKQPKQLG